MCGAMRDIKSFFEMLRARNVFGWLSRRSRKHWNDWFPTRNGAANLSMALEQALELGPEVV
jgi:hypothetical protein